MALRVQHLKPPSLASFTKLLPSGQSSAGDRALTMQQSALQRDELFEVRESLLREDDSVHVRGTVATAIGGIGRRARNMCAEASTQIAALRRRA